MKGLLLGSKRPEPTASPIVASCSELARRKSKPSGEPMPDWLLPDARPGKAAPRPISMAETEAWLTPGKVI